MNKLMKNIIVCGVALVLTTGMTTQALAAESTSLLTYDRAKEAKENYTLMHGSSTMPEAKNDPELAAIMQKYIYGDLAKQTKLSNTERQLVTLVMLTANQNYTLLARAVEGAYNTKVTPLEMREALYHVAPYIGFPKVFEALEVQNKVLKSKGVKLPLPVQGTTTDENRFQKGLKFQVDTYGERINTMRNNTPAEQKHLMDDLSAFCFGDIYTRGTLDLKTREMVTMAAIGSIGGADPQYKSHVRGTLAAGATKEEVVGVITTMNPYMGFPRTLNCLRIANEVFKEKNL